MTINIKYIEKPILKIVLLFLLISPIVCKAQINISNISLTNPNKRILYKGIDNKIVLKGTNLNDKVILKMSNCNIRNSGNNKNEYTVNPWRRGLDTLIIFKDNKVIHIEEYKIENVGNPKCYFKYVNNKKANKEDILRNPYLLCKIRNNYLKLNFESEVVSFKISSIHLRDTIKLYQPAITFCADTTILTDSITGNLETIITMKECELEWNENNKLTEYQLKKISELNKNDRLFISDIRIKGHGSIRKYEDMLITLE